VAIARAVLCDAPILLLSTIRAADQILVVEGGVIVERGTHDELIARCGRYRELHEAQFGLVGDAELPAAASTTAA
jgi:hypothetical protein